MADQTYLHDWHHDDYETVKRDIHRQLGNIDSELHIWGRQVLVAIYIRPLMNPKTNVWSTETKQMEDVFQGKASLIIKLGPDAFNGEVDYIKAMFGDVGAPKVGDWVFSNANSGISLSIAGAGAERVTGEAKNGEKFNMYPSSGWYCRIVPDDQFFGTVLKPHSVV
jgi:hypothetical protein